MSDWPESPEARLGLEHPRTKWLPYTAVARSAFLSPGLSPQDCLSVLTIWQVCPRASDPRGSKAEGTMSLQASVRSHTPSFQQYPIAVTQVSPIQHGRGPHEGMDTKRQGSLGPSWKLVTIVTDTSVCCNRAPALLPKERCFWDPESLGAGVQEAESQYKHLF